MRLLHLLQLGSTLGMCGLIWFVQVVHYPLFLAVGSAYFPAYEAAHANRTTYIVAPLMLIELATALLLLVPQLRPASLGTAAAWTAAALRGIIWLSTALVQVPLHNQLQAGYAEPVVRRLVATNWVRTIAWSLRAVIVLRWVWIANAG